DRAGLGRRGARGAGRTARPGGPVVMRRPVDQPDVRRGRARTNEDPPPPLVPQPRPPGLVQHVEELPSGLDVAWYDNRDARTSPSHSGPGAVARRGAVPARTPVADPPSPTSNTSQ